MSTLKKYILIIFVLFQYISNSFCGLGIATTVECNCKTKDVFGRDITTSVIKTFFSTPFKSIYPQIEKSCEKACKRKGYEYIKEGWLKFGDPKSEKGEKWIDVLEELI